MEFQVPQIFKNKLTHVGVEIAEELRKLIVQMKKLGLTCTDYTLIDNDVEMNIVEVCICDADGNECLSFALDEVHVTAPYSGSSYTLDADNMEVGQLLYLYNMYYANNINTIKSVG